MWNPFFFFLYYTPSLLPFIFPSFLSSHLLFIRPVFMELLISSSKCPVNNIVSCSQLTQSSLWRQMTMIIITTAIQDSPIGAVFKEVCTGSHGKWLELRFGVSQGVNGTLKRHWLNDGRILQRSGHQQAWYVCSRQILVPVSLWSWRGRWARSRGNLCAVSRNLGFVLTAKRST